MRGCFSSYAVSYATPVYHHNDLTINQTSKTYQKCKARLARKVTQRFETYRSWPNWGMLPGPMRSEPCWHALAGTKIADALELS